VPSVAWCLIHGEQPDTNLLTSHIISLFNKLFFLLLSNLSFGLFCTTVSFLRKGRKVKEIKLGENFVEFTKSAYEC